MWQQVCGTQAKEDDFVAWLMRLLEENEEKFKHFDDNDNVFVP